MIVYVEARWPEGLLYHCDVRAWILGSSSAASVAITNCACYSRRKSKTNGEWANHVGSMLLDSLDSDADVSVVILLHQWLNQLQNYSRDSHCSLRMRPQQDYTHYVILNTLTSLRDSHPLATRHSRESIMH